MSEIVAVLGAGSWGTALADLSRRRGLETRLWARDANLVADLHHDGRNQKYLPGAALDEVLVSSSLDEVLRGARFVMCAVPCAGVADLAREVAPLLEKDALIISGTKGLAPDDGARGEQLWTRHAHLPSQRYTALSGPNLAREMVAGVPTSSVIASTDIESAQAAQEAFSSATFRIYTNDDLVGVEMGGALKNIVAIAAGICDGLGFGDNSKAALMTRAWHEMTRLSVALGARESTLYGLSGVGDLMATCMSPHSRNHRLGCYLGRGENLSDAQHEVSQVAEGVHTTRAALQLAIATGVELPVTQQLAKVLFENHEVKRAVTELMNRQWRGE